MSATTTSQIHLFGVRHHGPGSSRSLCDALRKLQPDCILIEGPPEGDALISLVADAQMQPPVAMLVYSPEDPRMAAFYPFAVFSPEWQAMLFGWKNSVPVRFIDLPQTNWLGLKRQKLWQEQTQEAKEQGGQSSSDIADADEVLATLNPDDDAADDQNEDISKSEESYELSLRKDPLTWLAQAAGHSDGERWWEHMVEQRRDSQDLFEAIKEAMTTLRAEVQREDDEIDRLREAHMRCKIRAAQKEGFARIAIVCGAWHTPALADLSKQKEDESLLKGLPKVKVEATWIPWTHARLSYHSGYGAGVNSPGWYHHLWTTKELIAETWLSHVARLLRKEDLDASSASVIETVRLAEALAALRGRPLPGLIELTEATQAVLCFGSDMPLRIIHDQLIVGDLMGVVPDATPTVPLQKDLQAEQKRLRLPMEAISKQYDLDLRKENDLTRSHLLHRLRLLGIPWGELEKVRGKSGTFHEIWRLLWQPEFSLTLIERGIWGRTIGEAATSFACDLAQKSSELPQLTALLESTLLSDLATATEFVMRRVEDQAAVASDVRHLMDALPHLAQVARYGDVRKTDLKAVEHAIDGLVARICIGLPGGCASLNDEAAEEMFEHLQRVHSSIALLENEEHLRSWKELLQRMCANPSLHGLIAGRCCRMLLDMKSIDGQESARLFGLALSLAVEPKQAAAWAEGFLKGSGLLLIHDDVLWDVVDSWVSNLAPDAFESILPLMRRTFSTFAQAERRQMGERVAAGPARATRRSTAEERLDERRATMVLPVVALALGIKVDSTEP